MTSLTKAARAQYGAKKTLTIDLSGNDPTVLAGPVVLHEILVTVVLSAHTVTVGDDSALRYTIAASQAIGILDMHDMPFETNITVTPNASSTGTIVLVYSDKP